MAHSSSQARTWPYLLILAVLFYATLSIPRVWHVEGREQSLDQTLLQYNREKRARQARRKPNKPILTDVIAMTDPVVAEPSKPVAEEFRLPSHTIEELPPLGMPSEILEPLPEVGPVSDVDPPLPPDDESAWTVATKPDGWAEPTALIARLELLEGDEHAGPWATATLKTVRELTARKRPSPAKIEQLVYQVRHQLNELPQLIDRAETHHLKSRMRRARYSLARRADFWELTHLALLEKNQRLASRAPVDQLDLSDSPLGPSVASAISELRDFTSGFPEGVTWEKFLRIAELECLADVDVELPDAPNDRNEVAQNVLARLARVSSHPKYERVVRNPSVSQLREALRGWASQSVETEQLLAHIEQYEATRLPSDARQIALDYRQLAWAAATTNRRLGEKLARHYRNANVRMALSADLLNRMLPKPKRIDEHDDDFIGGVPTFVASSTNTELKLRLVPDNRRLHMIMEARGVVSSESESDAGFATLWSEGVSYFRASKPIIMDHHDLRFRPATAEAESDNELIDVMTRLDAIPLIGAIAGNMVRAQRDRRYGEVVTEVEAKVADKARTRLDEEVENRAAGANQRLRDKVVSPLKHLGLEPSLVGLQTTNKRLILRYRLAGAQQLGAHTARPRAPSNSLASWQIHQSAINNALERMQLAGKTFDLASLYAHLDERLNRPPMALDEDTPDDVEVTFASRDPIRIDCQDGRVTLDLAIRRLKKGRNRWSNFGIRAYYKPQTEGRQARLVRDGSFEIVSPKYGRKPQFLLRTIVARVLTEQKQVDLLPAKITEDRRLAGLAVSQMTINNGWIAMALAPGGHQPPPPERITMKTCGIAIFSRPAEQE